VLIYPLSFSNYLKFFLNPSNGFKTPKVGIMNQLRSVRQTVTGSRHGPIVRLVSPGDLGKQLKPFIFLDYLRANIPEGFGFGLHPHSGIATLTYQLDADVAYIDTESNTGILKATGLEWMKAGGGAWHGGKMMSGGDITGFQLWVSLPPVEEDGPSFSQYVEPTAVPRSENVKVLLGEYNGLASPIKTPAPMNYFDITLKMNERFVYEIPISHKVAWAFVYRGDSEINGVNISEKMVVLNDDGRNLEIFAKSDSRVLIGTAVPHPHDLVNGYYSVHTNELSLAKGESKINEIGKNLKQQGRI
jgi:redox-sensitive bicupin YhaK (pirin superfamily)